MSGYTCSDCNGNGGFRHEDGTPELCDMCNGAGDLLLARLDRIAAALEVLASDITERKERERAALVSQYQHLLERFRDRLEAFSSADKRLMRDGSEQARQYANRCESEMFDAENDLNMFIAANPGIDEIAGAS